MADLCDLLAEKIVERITESFPCSPTKSEIEDILLSYLLVEDKARGMFVLRPGLSIKQDAARDRRR